MKIPLLTLVLCGCAVQPLPNLQVLAPSITCSGRPTFAGWHTLRWELGITNAIILATVSEVPDPSPLFDITVKRFPIGNCAQWFGPVKAKLDAAAAAIGPGTAVICLHGKNRSRSAVIAWRVRSCGWTRADAIKEADAYDWWSSFPALLWYGRHVK